MIHISRMLISSKSMTYYSMCLVIYFNAVFVLMVFREIICVLPYSDKCEHKTSEIENSLPLCEQDLTFDGFNNETGASDGRYIVPNYVHFVKFGQSKFEFIRTVCILSAFMHQRPDKLFIHTDQERFHGRYWNIMMKVAGFKERLVIQKMKVPTEIFGHQLNPLFNYYHGGDVARLEILLKYGGIYLDTDSYVVRNLDDFRRFEMALAWKPGNDIGNQILIAHRNARFLRLWYNSYRYYNNESYEFNCGTYPTENILVHQPYLVHRVEELFGVYGVQLKIHKTPFPQWRNYYTIHLVTDHLRGPVRLNEKNIRNYNIALSEMCKAVYPFRRMQHLTSSRENTSRATTSDTLKYLISAISLI